MTLATLSYRVAMVGILGVLVCGALYLSCQGGP